MTAKKESVTHFGGHPIAEIRKEIESIITSGKGSITAISHVEAEGEKGLKVMTVGQEMNAVKVAISFMSTLKGMGLDSERMHSILHKVYDGEKQKGPKIEEIKELVDLLDRVMKPEKREFFSRVFGK